MLTKLSYLALTANRCQFHKTLFADLKFQAKVSPCL